MENEEFKLWIHNLQIHIVFFDGSSKENPGLASVDGIIFNPTERIVSTISCGLGIDSNN